jgi:hypothetical protein
VGKRGGYYIPAGKGREKKNIFKIYWLQQNKVK